MLSGLGALLALGLVVGLSAWLLRIEDPVLQMERLIEAWGPFAVLASIGLTVAHSFVPFPAEMLAIANGMLFGRVWGTNRARPSDSSRCLITMVSSGVIVRQDRAEIDDADPGAQTAVRLAEFAPERAAADDDQMPS